MKMKCKSYAFLACLGLLWPESAAAQERAVALISGNYKSVHLKEVLVDLEERFHLTFSYIDQMVDSVFVTAAFQDKKLSVALEIILKDTGLSFKMPEANNVILFPASEPLLKKYVLRGTIIDHQTGEGLPYVNVIVRGFLKGDASDSSGFYKIERLEPDIYDIDFEMLGYKKSSKRLGLVKDTELNVALEQRPVQLEAIEITPAVIEISAAEPSVHVLSSEEILASANFLKDVYRSVQVLPGISNTDFSAKPHIKGGNPDETAVFLDNMPIFEPFHLEELFDGAYGIINTEQVRHLKLLTGGFSAKYPEKMSGVIEINTVNSVAKHTLQFTFDYLRTGLFFNQRIGDKLNYFLSVRRTNFDFLSRTLFTVDTGLHTPENVIVGSADKIVPINFDLWNKLDYRINPNHHLAFNFLYAIDDIEAVEGASNFRKPEYVHSSRKNAYGWVNWRWLAGKRLSSLNTVGLQKLSKNAEFTLDLNVFNEIRRRNYDDQESDIFTFRQQNLWQAAEKHLAEFGLEVNRFRGTYFYDDIRLDRLRTTRERAIVDTLYLSTKISGHTLSGYLQDTWTISKRLNFLLGFRVSEQSFTGKPQFAPRSAVKINFSDHLNLKLAYGWYYQPDNFHKLKTYLGATALDPKPEKSIHYVGGLSFTRKNLNVNLDAYFKDYVRLNDDFQFDLHQRLGNPVIVDIPFNTQTGASKGMEIFIRAKYARDHLVSLAYSLSKNRMTDDLGRTVPRDFDRTHALNVNSVFKFWRGCSISALWRFHSGDPFTPAAIDVPGDSAGFNDNDYVYFITGAKNSARYSSYHSLDVKIQKAWRISKVKLVTYLNVLNVYNQANVREINLGKDLFDPKLLSRFPYDQTFLERLIAPGISIMF